MTTTQAIEEIYIGLLGRAADAGGLNYWAAEIDSGSITLEKVRANIVNEQSEYAIELGSKTRVEVVIALYERMFERRPEAEGLDYWVSGGGAGVNVDQLVLALSAGAALADRLVLDNKVEAAVYYTGRTLDSSYSADAATAAVDSVDATRASIEASEAVLVGHHCWSGLRLTLTTATDELVGTVTCDRFFADDVAGIGFWNEGDSIDGGAEWDTLYITTAGGIAFAEAFVAAEELSIVNVEEVSFRSSNAITINASAARTTGVDTVEAITITAAAGARATLRDLKVLSFVSESSITVDIEALTGIETLNTITTDNSQTLRVGSTTNVKSKVIASTDDVLSIDGGRDVDVRLLASVNTGTAALILSNAVGTVTSSVEGLYSLGGDMASADTTINGGSSVEVTNSTGITWPHIFGAARENSNFTATQGDVVVNGGVATSTVRVTQDAEEARRYPSAGDGGINVVAGTVTVTDFNSASSTAAGSIASVTLINAGAASINSGALRSLTLVGTFTTVDAGTLGSLSSAANTSLRIGLVSAVSSGAVSIDADITSLDISALTQASTLAGLHAEGVTRLNVSGVAALTLENQTLAVLGDIVVSNAGGLTLGSALGNGMSFSGGSGADTITTGARIERVITMGAGNDTVTYGGVASTTAGKLGSVVAGSGHDTLVMSSAQAAAADGAAVFNSTWTGFETLRLSDTLAADTRLNLEGLNGVSRVELSAGGAHVTSSILDNLVSGGTVVIAGPSEGVVVRVVDAAASANDSLNIHFGNDTGNSNAYGTVTVAEVETIKLTTLASGLSESSVTSLDSLTLAAVDATTITLAGNRGLDLNTVGNSAVTTFDASGLVGDDVALLGVNFTSANATTTANVSITGGAGHDVLRGNAAQDVINGGAGADWVAGGGGADVITVGNGHDTIAIGVSAQAGSESATAGWDVIRGFTLATAITVAVDLQGDFHQAVAALHAASSVGGSNMSLLSLAASNDNLSHQALSVAANALAETAQTAGVSYTLVSGILTLGGENAGGVDTLEEWLAEAEAAATTGGETLAFEFEHSTYVFAENGSADIFVQLSGLTGVAALALTSDATTGIANTLYLADTLA
ncbi:MAG: hypothetical protein JKX92_14280 [Porticoccaceae bacterium]|nr:hypothetical protein [Porticoccaceae bacterium]